ncbi:unnamed protein product, partial [Ascophyllum nodosum]
NKKTCYKLGTLSFQSHLKCYLEYLATNQPVDPGSSVGTS